MQTKCAWCKSTIIESSDENNERPVSHGICNSCAHKMFADMAETMNDYLNRLPMPILVIDGNDQVVAANAKALEKTDLRPVENSRLRAGDVIECVHAIQPEGCGKTIHCRACILRRTILHTHKTGLPCSKVPASNDLQFLDKVETANYLISTEKVGELVVVKIEDNPGSPDLQQPGKITKQE